MKFDISWDNRMILFSWEVISWDSLMRFSTVVREVSQNCLIRHVFFYPPTTCEIYILWEECLIRRLIRYVIAIYPYINSMLPRVSVCTPLWWKMMMSTMTVITTTTIIIKKKSPKGKKKRKRKRKKKSNSLYIT